MSSQSNRVKTATNEPEKNLFSNKYLIKRPVIIEYPTPQETAIELNSSHAGNNSYQPAADRHAITNPITNKRRLELFIDLIWVGIIGNLAENLPKEPTTRNPKSRWAKPQAIS